MSAVRSRYGVRRHFRPSITAHAPAHARGVQEDHLRNPGPNSRGRGSGVRSHEPAGRGWLSDNTEGRKASTREAASTPDERLQGAEAEAGGREVLR